MADTVVVKAKPPVRVVKVKGGIPGRKGEPGDTGNPGIIVSATPPASPQENDLWVVIP